MALPYPKGSAEAAADELASHFAYERVFGWEAAEYANLGEQADAFKSLRRKAVPKLVELTKELIGNGSH